MLAREGIGVAMQLTFLGIKSNNKYIPWFPSVFPSDELFFVLKETFVYCTVCYIAIFILAIFTFATTQNAAYIECRGLYMCSGICHTN